MKRLKLTKIMASVLVGVSVLALNPIAAHADWRQDNQGWWYSVRNSWATGWKQIDGKWYYFDSNGYMVTNTNIDGYQIDNNGVWVQNTTNVNSNNTTNVTNNINNGVIVNGDVSINNIASNNLNNVNDETKASDKGYNGTDGFVKLNNDQYVYYENGKKLVNTWKKFDEGYRHFDENGYMDFSKIVDGLGINEQGLFNPPSSYQKYKGTKQYIFLDIKPYYNVIDMYSGDIKYITNTYDVFGINYEIQYKDVYDSSENGQLMGVDNKFIGMASKMTDDNFNAEKIITIGKYVDRVKLS